MWHVYSKQHQTPFGGIHNIFGVKYTFLKLRTINRNSKCSLALVFFFQLGLYNISKYIKIITYNIFFHYFTALILHSKHMDNHLTRETSFLTLFF